MKMISTSNALALSLSVLLLQGPAIADVQIPGGGLPPKEKPDQGGTETKVPIKDCGIPPVNFIAQPDWRDFVECTTADGFPGKWGCRPTTPKPQTVCLPFVEGIVIGDPGDSCGCCGFVCPETCECPCDDVPNGVLIQSTWGFGMFKSRKCYPKGLAEVLVAMNDDYSCFTRCMRATDGFN